MPSAGSVCRELKAEILEPIAGCREQRADRTGWSMIAAVVSFVLHSRRLITVHGATAGRR